jgi:hypothetical protein
MGTEKRLPGADAVESKVQDAKEDKKAVYILSPHSLHFKCCAFSIGIAVMHAHCTVYLKRREARPHKDLFILSP